VSTGAGAGKFLGVRRNFARMLPNLPENTSKQCPPKKMLFMSIRAPLFSNQSVLSAICVQKVPEFRGFSRILWDFARIFTISKLLGVQLQPLHPHLLHQCL